ncbi:MAG: cyanophycin synthetase [Candidatus Peregrinibacteria bacterium]
MSQYPSQEIYLPFTMAKNVFLCGIGGSGMSALARFFLSEGYSVFGSDSHDSSILSALEKEGATVFRHQSAENILLHPFEEFIYSEAIPEDHPERIAAELKEIPQKKYFEKLGEITKGYLTVCIAGTHGKSSTTAMVASVMRDAGLDITALVGANVHEWGGKNFLRANSDPDALKKYFVVEACEYRESFLNFSPYAVILTNVEPEHLDYFKTEENYFAAFQKLLAKLPQFGLFVSDHSDLGLIKILPPNFYPRRSDAQEFLDQVPHLKLEGEHQRENASKVLAFAEKLKIPEEITINTLEQFSGLSRRFERRGEKNNILVIEDYAHHPTAVKKTLIAARNMVRNDKRKKLWVVFQPHQYSRTADFLEEFSESFEEADEVLIPNIYASRDSENDKKRITAEEFTRKVSDFMVIAEKKRSNVWGRGTQSRTETFYKKRVRHTENFQNTLEILKEEAWKGDVIIIMGAGSITELADMFLNDGGDNGTKEVDMLPLHKMKVYR